MKTAEEISREIRDVVRSTELASMITGEVSNRPRKTNSKNVDIIVSVISTFMDDVQNAYVNINIYVPNIPEEGESGKNSPMIAKLSRQFMDELQKYNGGSWHMRLESQTEVKIDGIDAYCINNRMFYENCNN